MSAAEIRGIVGVSGSQRKAVKKLVTVLMKAEGRGTSADSSTFSFKKSTPARLTAGRRSRRSTR